MTDGPVVDGRDAEALSRELKAKVPYYTPDWEPDPGNAGTALLEVFSHVVGDVVERLDQAPEKHRVAFLDAMGFDRRPPRPARLPVVFRVSDGATGNVPIPGGTEAVADAGGIERTFEVPVDEGFEATPSRLQRLYSVVPRADQVFEHWSALGAETVTQVPLFDGTDVQGHALYVAGGSLLDLQPGSTVRLSLHANVPEAVLRDCLIWEYYGEEERGGEPAERWHPLDVRGSAPDSRCDWSDLRPVETFLDAVAPDLARHGFVPEEHPPAVRYRLLVDIAADLRASRSSGPGGRTLLRNLLPTVADEERESLEALLGDRIADLSAGLRGRPGAGAGGSGSSTRSVELDLGIPGVATPFAVDGVESRWLRCRLPRDDLAGRLFGLAVSDLSLGVGPGVNEEGESGGLLPDRAFANAVPLSVDGSGEFLPFGAEPQRLDALHVASSEAFTKTGTEVELRFTADGTRAVDGGDPTVSWEYWNGSGWVLIDGVTDGTGALTGSGRVEFVVPADLEPTTVAGQEGHWVRARLVGGTYGRVSYAEVEEGSWERVGLDPPRFRSLRIEYEQESPPAHVLASNNRAFGPDLAARSEGFRPFEPLPDGSQTLYFGFDGPLRDGPVQLLFSLADGARAPAGRFHPRLQWEYLPAGGDGEWTPLAARDGTRGLTQRGVVGLVFPDETGPSRLFGERRHWVRARVTGDPFALTAATAFVREESDDAADECPEAARRTVETEPFAAGTGPASPVLDGLYPNACWVHDARTVTDELLGSSDGTPDQSFGVSAPPATHAEVWVDELAVLSAGSRRDLAESRPEGVEAVVAPDEELRRFWVRWERVPDFLGSGPDERHFTLDGTTGRVAFGDGVRGWIPPRGRDNVRASYRTGGGSVGNVPAGALTALKSSIPLVDAVTNPEPGEGGADGESVAAAVTRASRQLRDRDRAVTDADFERVAASASPELARVRCLRVDRRGEPHPGWVTLLVVPATTRPTPTPSAELRERVREGLRERAPATLVDSGRLVVRGPSYVAASVRATLVAEPDVRSVSMLEETAAAVVTEFFHPLSGGGEGDGWAFGELPYLSDVFALLEDVDGVDHVDDLVVTFRGTGDPVVIAEGDPLPAVAPDVLVQSGTHEIRAEGGRR
jgi:predicted phage baseplate assembly protein